MFCLCFVKKPYVDVKFMQKIAPNPEGVPAVKLTLLELKYSFVKPMRTVMFKKYQRWSGGSKQLSLSTSIRLQNIFRIK